MTKKEQILQDLQDLAKDLKKVDIAKKYDVEPSYISHIIKEQEILKKIEMLDRILIMIKKKALKGYKDKMTEEEREFWQTL